MTDKATTRTSSRPRGQRRLLSAFIVLFISFLLFAHFYVPQLIVEIQNPIVKAIKGESNQTAQSSFEGPNKKGRMLTYSGFENDQQSAFLEYSTNEEIKGTVILVHGIRNKKEHFIGLSKRLNKQGYHAIAVDLRAHGESKGDYCTFGVKEKYDIQKLIDHISADTLINENLGIWGQSLGAAVSLQALAIDDRIKFGIIESTFTDYRSIANDYVDIFAGFNFEPLTDYFIERTGVIANFNIDEARPIDACQKITQPILMVHGTVDDRIDIKYGKANYQNLKTKEKEFVIIEGGNHKDIWEVGGEQYFNKVFTFLAQQGHS